MGDQDQGERFLLALLAVLFLLGLLQWWLR